MKSIMAFSIIILLFVTCKTDVKTYGRITERKHLNDSMLRITFSFTANNETIIDSFETKNKILPADSLEISYKNGNPKSHSVIIR